MHYITLIDGKLYQTEQSSDSVGFANIDWIDWNASYERVGDEFVVVPDPEPEQPTFEDLRAAKVAQLEQNWQAFVEGGFLWVEHAVRYKIDDASRAEFSNGRLSVIARGLASADAIGFNIVGYHVTHYYPIVFSNWTAGEFLLFCTQLEQYWIGGWNKRTSAIVAIMYATTEAELDAIDIEVGA